MPAVYLCNVIGDGVSTTTAFRPSLPPGRLFACLMIHEVKARAIIVSPDNTLTGTGIVMLISDTSWDAMRTKAATTNPTAGQRINLSTWLAANGYQPLKAAQVTWLDCIHFMAQQVNPAADLYLTEVG